MTFATMMRKKTNKVLKAATLGVSLTVGAAAAVLGAGSPAAHAEQRGPVQRTVEGKVVDKGDGALKDAVVYLKDTKTLAVKSYLSDDEGHFHFSQLSENTDYEIWAEVGGKRSSSKSISSFSSHHQFIFTLKIDTEK